MIDVGSVFPADALNIFLIPCLITARNAQSMNVHARVLQAASDSRATEQPYDARAFRLTPIATGKNYPD